MEVTGITFIGNRLRKLRRKQGLTQAQLAEKCQVGTSTICSIEKGLRRPSSTLCVKIGQILGEDPKQLFLDTHMENIPEFVQLPNPHQNRAMDPKILIIHRQLLALEEQAKTSTEAASRYKELVRFLSSFLASYEDSEEPENLG